MKSIPAGLMLCAAAVVCYRFGPGWLGAYWGLLVLTALLQGTLVLSYDLLGGYGGELPLGHGAFFGIGAYVTAICLERGGGNWSAVIWTVLASGMVAYGLRWLLVPLRGVPFALCSLAVLMVTGLVAHNLEITGGSNGLSLAPTWTLAQALPAALLLFAVTFRLHDTLPASRFGRALRACASDLEAARQMGIHTGRVRGSMLVYGALPAALAGTIYTLYYAYISPQSGFGLETAMAPVVMVLVGGPGTRFGPLLGLLLLTALQEWLFTRGWQWSLSLWGVALMISGLFLPRGLAGLVAKMATGTKTPPSA